MSLGAKRRAKAQLLLVLACAAGASNALASAWRTENADEAAPQGVPAPLRERLGASALRVERDGAPFAELWLVREPRLRKAPVPGLGIAFPQLEPGTPVGLLRLHRAWEDYRKQTVRPGLYVLRYALQPEDGNHIGVSSYRDFLLLVPPAEDAAASEIIDPQRLTELSRAATGTAHPAVLALFPAAQDAPAGSVVRNGLDQPMVVVALGSYRVGLVLEGHGELEGY